MNKRKIVNISALLLLWTVLFQTTPFIFAQQTDINDKIRKEGMDNSKIMHTLHYLTDVYGPRLTGSPMHKAAADWAVKQMKEWGLDNVHLEPWTFGHPGWVNERAAGFITSPVQDSLVFEVLSWTPSTNGIVSGQAISLVLPDRPTQTELDTYLSGIKSKIKGNMVLVGKPAVIPVTIEPQPKRLTDDMVKRRLDPNNTGPQNFPAPQPTPTPKEGQLTGAQIGEQLDKFLVDNGFIKSQIVGQLNELQKKSGQELGQILIAQKIL